MALPLPALETVQECAEFSNVVEPFLPQLYELPLKLRETPLNRDALLQLYAETNPLISAAAFCLLLVPIFFVTAEFNRNFSQVDRAWSILPGVFAAHFSIWARYVGEPHDRVDLVAAFAAVWSVRLTYNYWRKGGYNIGSEDYRWDVIRQYLHPVLFSLFDLLFIAFSQSILLFLFSAVPTYVIFLVNRVEPGLRNSDYAYFEILFALILSELISDGQQWRYQTAKREYQKTAKLPSGFKQVDLDRGFITSGLWAYSRHPNFIAEQLIWFCLYQWSCYSANVLYSFAGIGAWSLILLFQGSTWMTELLSSAKYPEYFEYQKAVGKFFPTSLTPYSTPKPPEPKVIRTSQLGKKKSK